ncbi:Nitrogenase iron-molybdenum cofactor biosynthesis protein NifN [uncultured Defluviicoccus sp.]|uniref:Nitrogenase iron-molybdenum cofactor biosynthesis protein NifN n=1 Tax=metagenome TaxID=256318 RepID=A0A380TL53_9ZZZZ|nr:Nitrogenase iron-molybdenum cofactor biosynthesis protein NifN [uncultured Defluviicoccus sp.]
MNGALLATKACAVKPLKVSPALGGALAFLGLDRALPLLHGSQGCTAFAVVLAVRHFREAIPLQTTAMSEINTILGGADNLEQAIENIFKRAAPAVIGICSTALTETRDDDIVGDLKLMRERHPDWDDLAVVYARTPDFLGSLEQGWGAAVEATIRALVPPGSGRKRLRQVNLLTGSHLTPGDVEAIAETITAFGLTPIILPDISGSLDGHVADAHVPTTLGGTTIDAIRRMGHSVLTLAVGDHMRGAAALLEDRCGVPFRVFDRLTGLAAFDGFVAELIAVSGAKAPEHLQRQRSRLVDAMLDSHGTLGNRTLALAGEGDMLVAMSRFVTELGARVAVAVAPCATPALAHVPAERIIVGDLDDLEQAIAAAGTDSIELIVANSHAAEIAQFFDIPLMRAGFPIFDRLGAGHQVTVGYEGSRTLMFALANTFIARGHAPAATAAPGATLPPFMGETDHAPASSC